MESEGTVVQKHFYPFACLAVNCHPTVCLPHRDFKNVIAGVCCIMPFGDFQPHTARLVVQELELEIEVAPGVPIFIPSAVFTHWNTAMEKAGVRGSIVYWTGAALFQWLQLGFRSLKSLSKNEHALYKATMPQLLREGISRFPIIDQ